jgi:GNAT superfamily N-acetyltransferase
MAQVSYRPAELADAPDLHALLLALAPEIPLLAGTLQREEALYATIRHFARSGASWVALDGGALIGFALAAPVEARRHYAEGEVLELRWVGVAPEHRRRGLGTALAEPVCARGLPVIAAVNAANRSGIDRLLARLGFRQTGTAGGERQYRREP